MRDELFSYFVDLGHRLCYYRAYYISTRRISNIYSGFLMLASASGIVTLASWSKFPALFAILAFSAQVLQTLRPLTQASRQRAALKYILQDTESLFDEVQAYWDSVGAYDPPTAFPEEIAEKLSSFRARYKESFSRFSDNIDFSFKERLDQTADEENQRYFRYYYNVEKEETKMSAQTPRPTQPKPSPSKEHRNDSSRAPTYRIPTPPPKKNK